MAVAQAAENWGDEGPPDICEEACICAPLRVCVRAQEIKAKLQ